MRRAEMTVCLVFVLLGAHVVYESTHLSYMDKFSPGPGFLPFWLGWAWIGFSLLHFANIAMQPHLYPGPQPFPSGVTAVRPLSVYGVLLAGVFILGTLGLIFALSLMVFGILRGIEKDAWRPAVIAAAAVSLTFYLLFAVVLGVPFPRSPIGI